MSYAEITGWGKYVPPTVMSNEDICKVVDTSVEWISSRSGIKNRHYTHVSTADMAWMAAEQAVAAAGLDLDELDMLILGTTTGSSICPNSASYILNKLGAGTAGCMDLNSACTSWFYALTNATAMIRSGAIKKALVIGAEHISMVINWHRRESAVLFGDGAGAVVIEATDTPSGLLSSKWSTVRDTGPLLEMHGLGVSREICFGHVERELVFEGRGIFKNAVRGMAEACAAVLAEQNMSVGDIDLFIPHQANIRIIEALADRLNFPMDKVVVRIDEYANTSAASMPTALCDALEAGRLKPGMNILMATFGGGLTCGAGLVKWGERLTPLGYSDKSLPGFDGNVFDLMKDSFDYYNIDVEHLLSNK